MCIILQKYYRCITRQGVRVDPKEEVKEKGESHHPGRFLVPCSTPLMIPELNQDATDNSNIMPCWGTMDTKVLWYDHPCPDCLAELPYMEGMPVREETHPFVTDRRQRGDPSERDDREAMRRAIERTAESLAKTLYCWVRGPGAGSAVW